MNRPSATVLYLLLAFLCSGCARFPDSPPSTGKQLVLTLKVRGKVTLADPVNPSSRHYYFIAIDNDSDPYTGPWAVAFPPFGGNGWVTSRDAHRSLGATSFIEYSSANPSGYLYEFVPGSYLLQYTNPQPPLRLELLEGGSTLRVTIDLRQVATSSISADFITQLDINFITTNELAINPNQLYPNRQFDGLGPTGQDYVTIYTTVDRIYQGEDEDTVSPTDPDIDIVHWSVEIQTVSSR